MYLNEIQQNLMNGQFEAIYFAIGFAMLMIAISFKVAAFPFHQWAPDVYHGSPTIIAGFMSTAGKAAAITAFIIIAQKMMIFDTTLLALKSNSETIQLIIAILSAITMLLGNITALAQKDVKRMLAYSSVAHAGYLLMGIVANNQEGWNGILFYATAYMFMQLGAFVVISLFERQNYETDEIRYMKLEDYAGMAKTHPLIAALMAVFMFSLAGIPPFAGFFGKYYLFAAAIRADFLWLTIIAVISSIISMYYYIGLIVYMYFKDAPEDAPKAEIGPAAITLFLTVAGLIVFGVFPSILIDLGSALF
jgi:NADH-quinone oxidoreductase subunit N